MAGAIKCSIMYSLQQAKVGKLLLLSIGMIVKNEEKYLRRCLQALSPILKQVDSELIIADTGSTDGSIEIAREFTDSVFSFEWCDDFSAARNSTMQKARGKWYMFIDADEILDDAKEIISFFNTGEYKKFKSASYIIKSANDAELKRSTDFNAIRLIQLQSDSYFVHPVHEQFECIYGPAKNLSAIAFHYGYVTENNEAVIQYKMNRNLKILLSELQKNPNDSMQYLNICNAYKLLKEYGKALEYCSMGLASSDNKVRYPLYSNMIMLYLYQNDYAKALQLADEYFQSKQEAIGTDLAIYYMKAKSCFHLGKSKEAIQSYKDYLCFLPEFRQGMHNTVDIYQHSIIHTDESSYRTAVLNLVKLLVQEKDFESAESYLHAAPSAGFLQDPSIIPDWLELEVVLMKNLNNFTGITEICEQLDGAALEDIQRLIDKELANEHYRELILKEFVTLKQPKNQYSALMKLRSDYYADHLSAENVQNFISCIKEWTPLYADAAYFALKAGLPVQTLTKKIEAYDVGRFFYTNTYFHFDDLPYLVYEICKNQKDYSDTHSQLWISFLYFLELTSGRIREESISGMFLAYSKAAFLSMTALFKEDILTLENASLLPLQFKVGYYCHMAASAFKDGDKPNYLKHLREIITLCPQLKKVVETLADQFQKELNPPDNSLNEFEAYAARVKQAIRDLMAGGKLNEAAEFLKAYEKLCPLDKEVLELKSKIEENI